MYGHKNKDDLSERIQPIVADILGPRFFKESFYNMPINFLFKQISA